MLLACVEFPIRLPSTTNQRIDWRKKAKQSKEQRQATRIVLLAECRREIKTAKKHLADWEVVAVTFVRIAEKRLDDDNLRSSFKAVRDEVAAMLGVDDRDPRVEWHYDERKSDRGTHAAEIRIEIASTPDGPNLLPSPPLSARSTDAIRDVPADQVRFGAALFLENDHHSQRLPTMDEQERSLGECES